MWAPRADPRQTSCDICSYPNAWPILIFSGVGVDSQNAPGQVRLQNHPPGKASYAPDACLGLTYATGIRSCLLHWPRSCCTRAVGTPDDLLCGPRRPFFATEYMGEILEFPDAVANAHTSSPVSRCPSLASQCAR
jgi:hypothetical protein